MSQQEQASSSETSLPLVFGNLVKGKLYEISAQATSYISDATLDKLHRELARLGKKTSAYGVSSEYMNKSGSYLARLERYMYQTTSEKLTPLEKTSLGNIIANSRIQDPATVYYFDLYDKIDWSPGQFGDSGSCFWGGRATALYTLKSSGVHVIRIFRKLREQETQIYKHGPTGYTGIGRAWLHSLSGGIVLFNLYIPDEMRQATIHSLSREMGLLCTPRQLRNSGETNGTIFVNSGQGYWFHKEPTEIKSILDLGLIPRTVDDRSMQCFVCDAQIPFNGTTYEKILSSHRVRSGAIVCPSCRQICNLCGYNNPTRDFIDLSADLQAALKVSSSLSTTVCITCVMQRCKTCVDCGLIKAKRHGGFTVDTHKWFCNSCLETKRRCEQCMATFENGMIHDPLCQYCFRTNRCNQSLSLKIPSQAYLLSQLYSAIVFTEENGLAVPTVMSPVEERYPPPAVMTTSNTTSTYTTERILDIWR